MKLSTNVVLRYCPSLDTFVKVRVLTETEIDKLLGNAQFKIRREYVQLLLTLCLPEYPVNLSSDLLKRLGGSSRELEKIENDLYDVCVDLNPHLRIEQVTIPVFDPGSKGDLYLLEASPRLEQEKDESHKYLQLEDLLEQQVVGQHEAVVKLAKVLRRAAAGLRDPERPVGSFFFLGQTGVGKTELAKALAASLYGKGSGLVRIDCSEFGQSHEYAKLIGAPPGYIGHQEGGQLTDAVMAQGRAVVLFDEIEKAHPKVHQLLLQILDEGLLTDNKGRKASFRDVVIILTSNVGAREVEDLEHRVGFGVTAGGEAADSESMKALRANFPPEFLNRIDEIVVFHPLGRRELLRICGLLLSEVERYLEPKGIGIEFDEEVREFLVDEGTDCKYGARPLRRTVQRHVIDPLAEDLLAGHLCSRRIRAHLRQRKLQFEAG